MTSLPMSLNSVSTASTRDSVTATLPPDQLAELAFRIIFYVIGTIGNVIVLFIIIILRDYKKNASWYVFHLAIADLIFLQMIPIQLAGMVEDNWVYPVWVCKLVQTILFLNYYASILFLTVMSVDRYLAICHVFSTQVNKMRSRTLTYVITSITWIVALLACIPIILYSDRVGIEPHCLCTVIFPRDGSQWCINNGFAEENLDLCLDDVFPQTPAACVINPEIPSDYELNGSGFEFGSGFLSFLDSYDYYSSNSTTNTIQIEDESGETGGLIYPQCMYSTEQTSWKIFIYVNFVVMFLLPLAIISFSYISIIWKLKTGNRVEASNSQNRDKERKKVVLVCALLVVLFAFCWLPFHAVHLAKLVGIANVSRDFCTGLNTVIAILALANSALNPFLYSFVGKNFREKVKKVANMIAGVEETSSSERPPDQPTAITSTT